MLCIFLFLILLFGNEAIAQCDPTVPVVEADLSSDPAASFTSEPIIRVGNCCGTSPPDNCVSFNITLHPESEGIIFDVCGGAVPGGALFYQIDCGPMIQAGEMICLDGEGPHNLTFCKPGNNDNIYCITSVPAPTAGPSATASEGCTAEITSVGFDPATITWTSVYPGPQGSLDGYLSCTDCPQTTVEAPDPLVDYADFMICGTAEGGCSTLEICDTVRVHFASTLDVGIVPEEPAICFGSVGTEVTVIGSGGFPPYNFNWSNGEVGETVNIDNAGSYSVTVSDTSGCPPATYNFEITEYDLPLSVDAGPDAVVCNFNEAVQLNGSFSGIDSCTWLGGNGSFSPDPHDPQATYMPTPEEIENGTVTLELGLFPDGDCPEVSDFVTLSIVPFSGTVSETISPVLCNGEATGEIELEVSGANPPYQIEWLETGSAGNAIEDLTAGNYTAVVTNGHGCTDTSSYEITEPEALIATVLNIDQPLCNEEPGGSVEVDIEGGVLPYEINWPGGAGPPEMDGLNPGNHLVTVTDANDCEVSEPFEIIAPDPLSIDVEDQSTVCINEDFTLSAEVTGGAGGFTYFWSDGLGDAPEHIVNLDEDQTFTVYAQDANGCSTDTVEIEITISTIPIDEIPSEVSNVTCNGAADGSINLDIDAVDPTYTVQWQETGETGNLVENLSPGIYTALITNSFGCTHTKEFEIAEPEVLVVDLLNVNSPLCNDGTGGEAEVEIEGGTSPYEISWSGTTGSETISGLDPGIYEVTVTDANGCEVSDSFGITAPNPLSIDVEDQSTVCIDEDFTLSAEVAGGAGGYTYFWSDGLGDAPEHIVNLDEDQTFTVYAQDANGCNTESVDIEITVSSIPVDEISAEVSDVSCNGAADGSITLDINEVDPTYTVEWLETGETGNLVENLSPGIYTALITNTFGCTDTKEFEITEPEVLEVDLVNVTSPLCDDGTGGEAEVDIDGGTLPYEISWSGTVGSETVTGLDPGNHEVIVTDANDCEVSELFEIIAPDPLSIDVEDQSTVCINEDFTLSAEVTGGAGGFTYFWSDGLGDAPEHVVNLDEDQTFTVYAQDANGCSTDTVEIGITISSIPIDEITAEVSDVTCYGAADGSINLDIEAVDPTYTVQWQETGETGNLVENLSPGIYTAQITNTFGCTDTKEFEITEPEVLVVDLVNVNSPLCDDGSGGEAEVEIEGGTLPYEIFWSGTTGSETMTGLDPGNHDVTVTDANNCEVSEPFEIIAPDPLSIDVEDQSTVCVNEDFTLSAEVNGGAGGFTYFWSDGLGDAPEHVVNLDEDQTFTVYAQDQNGCNTDTVEIEVLVISFNPDSLLISEDTGICPGETTEIEANYEGEFGPYDYQWSHGLPSSSGPHQMSPESSTQYFVTVTDICENSITDSVLIDVYELPEIQLPESMISGCSPFTMDLVDTVNTGAEFTHVWIVDGNEELEGNPVEFATEQPGVYDIELEITTSEGCTAESETSFLVEVYPSPNANFVATPWVGDIDNPEFDFVNTTTGEYSTLNWFVEDSYFEDLEEITYTFSDTGTYAVELLVANQYGCESSIIHTVTVDPVYDITIPNAFTPSANGGGGFYDPENTSNTIFYPFADYVEEFQMSIFNRWGELIFESQHIRHGWDGTYRDEPCPQDVYVYKVEFVFSDGHKEVRTGDITLFR